jgi:hypothetical protein
MRLAYRGLFCKSLAGRLLQKRLVLIGAPLYQQRQKQNEKAVNDILVLLR